MGTGGAGSHSFSRLEGSTQGVVYSTAGIPPHDLWLKVEAQYIHKLPKHEDYVLFSVRTYADKLETLANDHQLSGSCLHDVGSKACGVLAEVIRSLPESQLKYRDLGDKHGRQTILDYLDKVSSHVTSKNDD